jgi:hypothetical protein
MKKLQFAIKIVLLLNLILTIAFGIWILISGVSASQDAAQQTASQGAEGGSVIGGALAGGIVGAFGILFTIILGGIVLIYSFNSLIAFIIYCLKEKHGVFGGALVLLFACPIAGILIIIEGCKS